MLVGQPSQLPLERLSRGGCAQRMVGLVAAAVERGHHPIAGELLDLAAKAAREKWRRERVVGAKQLGDLVGTGVLPRSWSTTPDR